MVAKEVVEKNVVVVTEEKEEEVREGEDVVVATTAVLRKMTMASKSWLIKTRSLGDIVVVEVDIVVTEEAEVATDAEEEAEVTACVKAMMPGTLKDQSVTIPPTNVVVMDVDVVAGTDHKQLVTAMCEDGEL